MADLTLSSSIMRLPPISPMCVDCILLYNHGLGRTCEAFPKGIPDEIWIGTVSHRRPYSGDGGVTYLKRQSE